MKQGKAFVIERTIFVVRGPAPVAVTLLLPADPHVWK
jgi:hypothetical protein